MRGQTGNSFRETWSVFGCSRRNAITFVMKSQADGHIVKILEERCALSVAAVLVLRQGRFGMFIGYGGIRNVNIVVVDKPDGNGDCLSSLPARTFGPAPFSISKIFHSCDRYPGDIEFASLTSHRLQGMPSAIIRYSSKETAQGVKRFAPVKHNNEAGSGGINK